MLSWRTLDLYIKLIRVIFKLILEYLLSYELHFVTVIQRFCLLLHFKNFITIFVCKLLYCFLIPRNNYISISVNLGLDSDKSNLIILIIIVWISQDLKPTDLPTELLNSTGRQIWEPSLLECVSHVLKRKVWP